MPNIRPTIASTDYDRTVTLRDFFRFIARSRWILLASMVFFAAAIFVLAELLPPEYVASVTLVPASSESSSSRLGSLSSAVSQFSGLASLAGVNIGQTGGRKAVALATLKSRLLLNRYITRHNLLPILFARDWNVKTGKWRFSNPKRDPTLWEADQLFDKGIRTIKADARSGVVKLTIKWHNPLLAAQWANGLVDLTNSYLRQQTIDETRRDLAYLRNEITKTDVVGVRNALYSLMETELKTLMIATGRKQFAFRVVDPAIAPQRQISPRPLLWTLAGALFGIIAGCFIAVIRETLAEVPVEPAQVTSPLSHNENV
ncbi:MAG: hypothetical protein ACYCV6_12305 [Steroidobacteraceae bacterium]